MAPWKTLIAFSAFAFMACDAPKPQTTAPPAASATLTLAETPTAVSTPSAVSTPTTTASAPAHPGRALHPINPAMQGCLEMYSVCTGSPPRCTSAPLSIACNQSAQLPSTKEWLHCVCP